MDYPEEYRFVWSLRKYILLLATLVVSATYVAGLNPPGGLFIEDDGSAGGHNFRVGGPVLEVTNRRRYAAFFYCNAAAFLASLVIVMIMIDQRIVGNRVGLAVLLSAMVLDLLALMGAFAAGSCRGVLQTIYVLGAFAMLLAVHLFVAASAKKLFPNHSDAEEERLNKGRWKLPLLLAIFVTPLTYGAGLAPPGGFWFDGSDGHIVGDPVLASSYPRRHVAFLYCNAMCFVSSLVIVTLLMSRWLNGRVARTYVLQVCVLVELMGLMGAYAAGSCRTLQPTVYSVTLAGAVLLLIALAGIFSMDTIKKCLACHPSLEQESRHQEQHDTDGNERDLLILQESRSLLLLVGTLTATVSYQAGLNPPGGYWRDSDYMFYKSGHPGLLDVLPNRYRAFFHCNTTAFVASLVVIIVVQSKQLLISEAAVRRRVLQVAIILSLFSLMGAYAAGSCRDISTTIYIAALAVANVVVFGTLGCNNRNNRLTLWVKGAVNKVLNRLHLLDDHDDVQGQSEREEDNLKKKRKALLQLAILATTITYQTGLNSSGGFWEVGYGFSSKKHITDTILLGYDRNRYLVFFYCNAVEFMVSIAVILLLMNRRLHNQSIRSNVLQGCIMVGFLILRTAYAVGSTQKVSTSIYVYGLVAAVIGYLALQILPLVFARCLGQSTEPRRPCLPAWLRRLIEPLLLRPDPEQSDDSGQQRQHTNKYIKHKYLMLLAVLTASMTYQAGLIPPDGTWVDIRDGHLAGSLIMRDVHFARYQAFFHCNTTSFAASVVLMVLLLQRTVSPRGAPLGAMQAAMALDLAGLLGAYAAGSCWMWDQVFAYVTAFVAAVVIYLTLHVLLWRGSNAEPTGPTIRSASSNQHGDRVTVM